MKAILKYAFVLISFFLILMSTTLTSAVEGKVYTRQTVSIETNLQFFIELLRMLIAAAGAVASMPFAIFAVLVAIPVVIVELLNNYIIIPSVYLIIAIAYFLAMPLIILLQLVGMDVELPPIEEVFSKVSFYLKEMESNVEEFYKFLYLSVPFIACMLILLSVGTLSFPQAFEEANQIITNFIVGGGVFPY